MPSHCRTASRACGWQRNVDARAAAIAQLEQNLASSELATAEDQLSTLQAQATFVPGVDANGEPTVNDGKLSVSAGLVTSSAVFNKSFAEGQPYTLKFSSSTQYTLTDRDGNDQETAKHGNPAPANQ